MKTNHIQIKKDNMKKKICICLSSDYYLKYINFKAFESLEKNFEVNYLINQRKFHNHKKIKNKKLFFTKQPEKMTLEFKDYI